MLARRSFAGAPPLYDSARRRHPFVEELADLLRYWDLVGLWAVRNITLRYKRSVLGILWTLLEPLMMMVILTIVFQNIFRFAIRNYSIYVLTGIILFDFFSRSTTQIVDEITASQNLAQRIRVPQSAFALATVISYLVNWTLATIPLFLIMAFLDQAFVWQLVALPLAMLATACFALGVGLVVATLGAVFPDVKLTYNVLLSAWFYCTPVLYPIDIVPESYRFLFRLNPLYYMLEFYRAPIFDGAFAPPVDWGLSVALGAAVLTAGWWIFTRWRAVIQYRV